tara:strand:+ start:13141 stop:15234 length:2094 start_codon:yes stop_codon:yes gene_type:complete
MADFNKSVEITLKANIKQLQKNLEQIPGMTKKEASKMVRALSSEFNKAQKAAKRAAEESRKAAKASAKAFEESSEKIGESFKGAADEAATAAREIKVSFEEAAEETDVLAENSEAVATAFGSASLALDKLAPGMSETTKNALEMADGLATAAEQAIKGGPATMALTAGVVALAFAFDQLGAASREAAANLIKQLEQFKDLSTEIKAATDAARSLALEQEAAAKGVVDAKKAERDAQLELLLAQGKITKFEFDRQKLLNERDSILKKQRDDERIAVEIAEKGIKTLEEKRDLLDQEQKIQTNILNSAATEAEKAAAEIRRAEITQEYQDITKAVSEFKSAISDAKSTQNELSTATESEFKLRLSTLKQERTNEAIAKKRTRDAENLKAVLAEIEEIEQVTLQTRDRNADLSLSMLSREDQIRKSTSGQVSARRQQIEDLKGQVEATQILAQTEASREAARESEAIAQEAIGELLKEIGLIEMQGQKELDALKEQNHKREQERKDKERKEAEETERERIAAIRREAAEIGELGNLTIGTFRNSIETIQNVSKAAGVENAGLIRALFEMNRVAAIGEIAFNTAKAVTAAGALGPLAPLAIAAATTAAAAQTAAVLSQQPPKLHMGGMTPDERTVVVKTGEAVLDSSTVNRIGGEPGVRALQNGQGGSPQVIVMNPFKHFDRYMTDRQRAGLSTRSSRRSY